MAKSNKLAGKKLTVLSIYRVSLFDAQVFMCCDNCGTTIVNHAEVIDETGAKYNIGLDCKKTLIDKPIIDNIKASGDFMVDYKVKEYNKNINEISKFLKFCSYPNIEINIDSLNNIYIYDNDKTNQFGNKGETVYCQNVGFLYKHGLKPFIQKLSEAGKLSITR
jgi:hypothetical protein